MRFVHKINSGYDGFTPKKIPDRVIDGRFIKLGWERYLDDISVGDEVWVVFVGGSFKPSVYVKGLVDKVDVDNEEVWLRVRNSSTTTPLVDAATSAALVATVSVRYRQVFLWPANQVVQNTCVPDDCAKRQCGACQVWQSIPQIEAKHYTPPSVLKGAEAIAPAYWIIPARCFLYYKGRTPTPWVTRSTNRFTDFKIGEARYAFPFALGMHEALKAQELSGFDAIVPIPLSPEKIAKKELNRTAALAGELSTLMGVPVMDYLSLSNPISKRRMELQGFTITQFRERYREYLQIDSKIAELERIVLLDDVITRGNTLSVAIAAINALNPEIRIVVAAAGQMILKDVVADQNGPAW